MSEQDTPMVWMAEVGWRVAVRIRLGLLPSSHRHVHIHVLISVGKGGWEKTQNRDVCDEVDS